MLSIGKLVATQASYYTEQLTHSLGEDTPVLRPEGSGQTDYYTAHQAPSRWLGCGLDRLGLTRGSTVDPEDFSKLMNHETPAGEAMIVAKAHRLKVAAFDLTLSAPKSVSLLYAFGDEGVRMEVVAAHREAVDEALGYMETQGSQTRLVERSRDADGAGTMKTRSVASEGFVAAGFDHFTSRAQDPQVHTHVVVINRVWAEGGWRALDGQRAYAHAKAGGTIYEAKLREGLTRRLGVWWGPVTNGIADIEGFSPELIGHFSTRRTEILQAVERHLARHGGVAHRRLTQAFTLETRQAKVYHKDEPPQTRRMKDYGVSSTVESFWYQKAIDAPVDVISLVEQVVTMGRVGLRPTEKEIERTARTIIESLTQKQATFTERDVIAYAAQLYRDGATVDELTTAAQFLVAAGRATGEVISLVPEAGLVRPRGLPGEPRFTTRTQLERETLVLNAVTATSAVTVDSGALERSIASRRLVDEQAAALRHLSRLDGRLVALVGPGGSGKTYAIGAYAEAVRASGSLVIGAAASAAAAQKLGGELDGCWTGTVALLRHQLDTSRSTLPPKTVVIVDEGSMVSTIDLAFLVGLTEGCDGKLILIGDPMQLPSVDAGGLFHRIVADGREVVDEIAHLNQRQILELDRENLTRLRKGEIGDAVRSYSEAGRIHLGRNESATKSSMVEAWWKDVEVHGIDQVRMLASRRDEVEMLNHLARVQMTEADLLSGPVLRNRWGVEFQTGDRVVVQDNWYRHSDLRNGQAGTITFVDVEKGTVRIRRDLDGQLIDLPKPYVDGSLDWGYAQTIHTAQGQTFQVSHLYADTGVKAEHGYTALSRARGETHVWLNDVPGPLGECTHIHGDPLTENRIEALVRQLSQSIVEAPAHDRSLFIGSATDQELVDWRNDLEGSLRESPLAANVSEQMAAVEEAIVEAKEVAAQLGTRGARLQVRELAAKLADLQAAEVLRQEWLENNIELLHSYSAVSEELHHRLQAHNALYQIAPPEDLLQMIGPRPDDEIRRRQWDEIAGLHAKARIELRPTADLLDPNLKHLSLYQHSVAGYTMPPLSVEPPVLALRPNVRVPHSLHSGC